MAQPNNQPSQTNLPDANTPSALGPQVDRVVRKSRRRNFLRMLTIPVLFILILVAAVLVGHEQIARNEYLSAMNKLARQFQQFQKDHQRLPNLAEFATFDLRTRNLRTELISYEQAQILDDSPPDTLLAHSPLLKLRFRANGHAIVYLNGKVGWVSHAGLNRLLEQRLQRYNNRIIRKNH